MRNRLWSIALLTIDRRGLYFKRHSPVSFGASEVEKIPKFLTHVTDALVETVIPAFSGYCDVSELARAAPLPEQESWLLISPRNVAAILVAAGKRQEFEAWKRAYRKGAFGKPTPIDDHYMTALQTQLPQ
jgi:hypothetical protein